MKRNLTALGDTEYDLVIVGGGIFGICTAWDAALRGLSVALVERGDFAEGASANCFKMVHGGIRYLQHADLRRVRESSRERNVLLRIAPHLVRPMPFVVPTYGHGLKGKEILRAALLAYNGITFDRNREISDPDRRVPYGDALSRAECLELFPGVDDHGLTGAVIFYDGQMYSPARLALSYLRSASAQGAEVANYVEATGFLGNGSAIFGVKARDVLTGDRFEIRGKLVINAAGPRAGHLIRDYLGLSLDPEPVFSRDAFFLVRGNIHDRYALALQSRSKDADAILSRGHRHLFLVPWRNYTLIGVWHAVHKGDPDHIAITEEDIQQFLEEINESYPPLALTAGDISAWNCGLILFGDGDESRGLHSYGKRSQFIDHARTHGLEGLLTLIGVRYTTSRCVAEKVVDVAFKKLGRRPPRCQTDRTPIFGGRVERFNAFLDQALVRRSAEFGAAVVADLVQSYGSEYEAVLKYLKVENARSGSLELPRGVRAQIIYSVRDEMALTLADVVLRRTSLGTGEYPGDSALRSCAGLMAVELGWDDQRLHREVEQVKAAFPRFWTRAREKVVA